MNNGPRLNRRRFMGHMASGVIVSCLAASAGRSEGISNTRLAPWTPGSLDIHHISTGRGNCALLIMPDGTSAMIDAGDKHAGAYYIIDPKPDGSRRPGEWLGRYAKRHLKEAGRSEIDYFLLTHLHDDHMGEVYPGQPMAAGRPYQLTGVSDVAELVPIRCFIDRDFPDYSYPVQQTEASALNYIAFIKYQLSRGVRVERFRPGAYNQVIPRTSHGSSAKLRVQNLAANGEIWTGFGSETRHMFPSLATLAPDNLPSENMCSLALRLSYGKFDYYTGGDLPYDDNYGADHWRDIETPIADVAGPVEVAVVNHHGYVDAAGPGFVRALRPQAFIIEAWDAAHPVVSSLDNLMSKRLYPGDRDIYATAMKPENSIANKGVAKMRSHNGHVIVRVAPGGGSYQVLITTNADESDRITASFGPFLCT